MSHYAKTTSITIGLLCAVAAACGTNAGSKKGPGADEGNAAATAIAPTAGEPAPGGAGEPAQANPGELRVVLPPSTGGDRAAQLKVLLLEGPWDLDYQTAVVRAGDEPPVSQAVGEERWYPLPTDERTLQRLTIAEASVLVHARAGAKFVLLPHHDGGWALSAYGVGFDSLGSDLAYCIPEGDACRPGYLLASAAEDDPLCAKVRSPDRYRCVRAAEVRLRGPVKGEAKVWPASADGRFDDVGEEVLAAQGLQAGEASPWTPVAVGEDELATVVVDGRPTLLRLQPGDRWELAVGPDGMVTGTAVSHP